MGLWWGSNPAGRCFWSGASWKGLQYGPMLAATCSGLGAALERLHCEPKKIPAYDELGKGYSVS